MHYIIIFKFMLTTSTYRSLLNNCLTPYLKKNFNISQQANTNLKLTLTYSSSEQSIRPIIIKSLHNNQIL